MTTAAAILAFITVCLFIYAINLGVTDVFRMEESERQRVDEKKQLRQRSKKIRSDLEEEQAVAGGLSQLASQLEQGGARSPWEVFHDVTLQSGLSISPVVVIFQCVGVGVIMAGLGYLIFDVVGAVIVGGVGFFLPLGRVLHARSKRLARFREQLPDALELIGRILRAGQTMVQAMNSIGEEYPNPIGGEFARAYEQQNLGLPTDVVLRDMARRVGIVEMKIFVLGVLINRQAGGNMTELLERLAHMIRARLLLRGEIKGLTAEGRMQALVLIGLPFCVWLGLTFFNPEYAFELLDRQLLVGLTLGLMLFGAFWIHRIVNFEF